MVGKNTAASIGGPTVVPAGLLLMEDSLGEVRTNVHNIHDLLENLGRQLELISVEQERLMNDLRNQGEANRGGGQPRNHCCTPKHPRNVAGREQRQQELQIRLQDSYSSGENMGFLQINPRFAQAEPNPKRGAVHTDFKMKIYLPTFNGKMDVETFLDQVRNV